MKGSSMWVIDLLFRAWQLHLSAGHSVYMSCPGGRWGPGTCVHNRCPPHPVLRTWVSGQPTASGTVRDDRGAACTLVRAWRPWWKGGSHSNSLAPPPPTTPQPAVPVLLMDSDASLILVSHLRPEKMPLSSPIGLA